MCYNLHIYQLNGGFMAKSKSKKSNANKSEKDEKAKKTEEVKAEEEPMEAYAEETEETVSDDDLFDPMPLMKDKSEE